MITDNEKLLEYALTDENKANLDRDYNISVALKVELLGNSLSETEKDNINSDLNGYSIGKYLNISIIKTVVDSGGNVSTANFDTLTNTVKFIINIPDELKKFGRNFTVIKLHNGVAEVSEDSDTDLDTITIKSDRFSVYTLAYKKEICGYITEKSHQYNNLCKSIRQACFKMAGLPDAFAFFSLFQLRYFKLPPPTV